MNRDRCGMCGDPYELCKCGGYGPTAEDAFKQIQEIVKQQLEKENAKHYLPILLDACRKCVYAPFCESDNPMCKVAIEIRRLQDKL